MLYIPWQLSHFIGDYLIQTHKQAIAKKTSSLYCTIHVLTYMIPFLFSALTILQFFLIAVTHWIQDRTNIIAWFMDHTGKKGFREDLAPWSSIIIDNTWHFVIMYLIITYVTI